MTLQIPVRGSVDPNAVEQLKRCAEGSDVLGAAMMADGHLGYCVPLDTEILTRRGWLSHDAVVIGDETIGFDPKAGVNRWTPVEAVHHGYSPILKMGHSRWQVRVTPEHKWWADRRVWGRRTERTKPELVKTIDINSEHRLLLSRPFVGGDSPLSVEEAAILGWLLSDGCISAYDADGKPDPSLPGVSATIYQAKPIGREAVEAVLVGVPHSVKERDRPNTTWPSAEYRISSDYIRNLWIRAGLYHLTYEGMVLQLSPEARAGFLDAIIRAEATNLNGYDLISQNRGPFYDAINLLVYLCGHIPRPDQTSHKNGHIGVGLRFVHGNFLRTTSLGTHPVWCVTTASGSWTMRQDRRISLTGNSQPIGGVVAHREHVSVSGCGFDLNCGNKAVRVNVQAEDVSIGRIMDEIAQRIDFGMGTRAGNEADHDVISAIADADFVPQRSLVQLARGQLGTVGSGNHYVDLFEDEDGWLWVGVHFGSRGFGHKTASGFLAMAKGGEFTDKAPGEAMDSPPVLLHVESELGQSYLAAVALAGQYAYAGRDVVVERVLAILGNPEVTKSVHNHHNAMYAEEHFGETVYVTRKGATPAWPGQLGFVGATMGEPSVILEGIDSPAAAELFHSTVHGAGRVMSRTQAAGKVRRFKVYECNDRDCDYRAPKDKQLPGGERIPCPDHPNGKLLKRTVQEQVRSGEIDWDAAKADLVTKGIELRGAAADEAPGAYKRLDEVLEAHSDTIRILHTLTPLGVAMAGPDIADDFRD